VEFGNQLYVRKHEEVVAERVDSQDMEAIALWCAGRLLKPETGEIHIQVPVTRPENERQAKAYIGDWVLKTSRGWKVFTHKAFVRAFGEIAEPACGKTDYTSDHKPCVLGSGHMLTSMSIGCRSFQDYKVIERDWLAKNELV
jgi:hypothetical protein